MLKLLMLVVFSLANLNCDKMDDIRKMYGTLDSEEKLIAFIDLLNETDCIQSTPYMASATMQKAQYAFAPWTKYSYFMKGKKMLENYIKEYPEDVDARYVRFLVQSHIPRFLGYRKNIKEDAALILQKLELTEMNAEFKVQIRKHIEEFL